MKVHTLATIVTMTVGLASSQPHRHGHQHIVKRDVVTIYEFEGHVLSKEEVMAGIADGKYTLTPTSGDVESVESTNSQSHGSKPTIISSVFNAVKPAASPAPAISNSKLAASSANNDPEDAVSQPAPAGNVNAAFPDGTLSCSSFPSAYGAVALEYLGLGGWSGIQSPESGASGFDNILTKTAELCSSTSTYCGEGDFCSYACPPGYEKTQWPTTQGATGQSVGGLQCMNGKLHLTNPDLSNSLCSRGSTAVNVQVKNTLSQNAAVCRTDYPGTESETVPVNTLPGITVPLACPDASDYYTWKGSSTSAQYYLNPADISPEVACQWGNAGKPYGNYAPMNLGVGYSNGAAWLSIFPNSPTTDAKLDYTVELVGDNGGYGNFVGKCKYQNGQYCSGDNYEDCSPTKGCTVNVQSGTATYVLSD